METLNNLKAGNWDDKISPQSVPLPQRATIVEQLRQRIALTQREMQAATGLNAEQQEAAMFEAAFPWLDSIGCTGADQLHMTSTREFWGFWRLEYFNIDRLVLAHLLQWQIEGREHARMWYDYFHEPAQHKRLHDKAELNYHAIRQKIGRI